MTEAGFVDRGLLADDAVLLNIDSAVLGYTDPGILVYSYKKLIEHFIESNDSDRDTAYEWVDYNVLRLQQHKAGFVVVYGVD